MLIPNQMQAFSPQTNGLLSKEMQLAPKAAFMRALVSHLARTAYATLTPRDMVWVLKLLKESALGRDVPKPWTQDLSLRIVDRFYQRLLGGKAWKQVHETQYWQDQPIRDLTYTGTGALPDKVQQDASGHPLSRLDPQDVLPTQRSSREMKQPTTRATSDGLHPPPSIERSAALVQQAAACTKDAPKQGWTPTLSKPVLTGSDLLDEVCSSSSSNVRSAEQTQPHSFWVDEVSTKSWPDMPEVQWAYKKVYKIHRDAKKIVLGSLQVRKVMLARACIATCKA
jgi:hypothetical protein